MQTATIFKILRPTHWIKNLFIFAALFFSLQLFDVDLILRTLWTFLAFCSVSSGVYIFNDLRDLSSDRQHPIKSLRPIASGIISQQTASLLSLIFLSFGVEFAFSINDTVGWVIVAYVILNISYSLGLKHIVIVDVMIIAFGFVLRAVAGAAAIDVEFSHWLIMSTFLLALFLAFGKRRHEIVLLADGATEHRKVLTHYSPYFLDQMISVVTATTVVVYLLYVTSKDVTDRFQTSQLIYTVPFVLYGIFRYLYLIHRHDSGGDPTRTLLTDAPLFISIVLWVATGIAILYFHL